MISLALGVYLYLTSYIASCQDSSRGNLIDPFNPPWNCSVDSWEPDDGGHDCTKAFDRDDTTFWHTEYVQISRAAQLPHRLDIDLGQTYNVSVMAYLPRQDGNSNGNIGRYEINLFLDEPQEFQSDIGSAFRIAGTWLDDRERKTVNMRSSVPARFFRLRTWSEAGDRGDWTSAAQIDVYEDDDPNQSDSASSSNSVGSTSSTPTGTTPDDTADTQTPQPSPALSSSAKVGIGLGIPLGVLATAIIGFLILRHRRHTRSSFQHNSENLAAGGQQPVHEGTGVEKSGSDPSIPPGQHQSNSEHHPSELHSDPISSSYPRELAGSPGLRPQELQ
ncbi:MAG: hypothetical protein LQ337_004637 [Flavoplaca oasis]|nr:MAG: hypothetical protein LQ337_004637 [Flavoplaca oasis]